MAQALEVQSGGGTTLVRRQSSLEDNETTDAAEASDTLEAELTKAAELRKEMKNATAGAGDKQISEDQNWHWQELSNSSNGSTGANGTAAVQEKGNGTERKNETMELFNSSNITQPREDRSWLRGSYTMDFWGPRPWPNDHGCCNHSHVSSVGKCLVQ